MKKINSEVIKGFGMNLKNSTQIRSGFICETNQGLKAVKQVNQSIDALFFQHSAKEHLYRNGFSFIDRFYLSTYNTPYYIHDGKMYVMTDWIKGRECDFNSIEDVKKAVAMLAKMHRASKGMIPLEGSRIRSNLGKMPEIFEKRMKELSRMKKKVGRKSRMTDFDLLFLKNYRYYENLCKESIEVLSGSKYKEIVEKTDKEKSFCHYDYTYHHLIFDEKGQVYVTDFDRCCYDIRICDLANIMKRYLARCHWNIDMAYDLLRIYDKQKTIEKEEQKVLLSLLMYPEKFLKTCGRYYNNKRTWNVKIYVDKLMDVIKEKENHYEFIQRFK